MSGNPAQITASTTLLTDNDLFLFNEGSHYRLFEKLGSHLITINGVEGAYFAVWAPNAQEVNVIGDFNDWDKAANPLKLKGVSGIWEGFIPGVKKGAAYKYFIKSKYHGYTADKADPFAVYHQVSPQTGSIVWDLQYQWNDDEWMEKRSLMNGLESPLAIYEVHPGSWQRVPEDGYRSLTYRELAHKLVEHLKDTGFTHVEFLPVMEHPFFGSWGYQCTGFFAPTSRYGTPQDFMYLVDYLHQHGFGVILDWVPSHFPTDEHGLGYFDGTHLFEHADARQGFHPDWSSFIFNYGREEVRSFLISNAIYWLEKYHADGLRIDAVASMLYLDYSREEGEWIPNRYGGRENLEAIDFLRRLNEQIYIHYPDVETIAEESTSWPMVSRPTYIGGLGFGMKWDMGWMHDTLHYVSRDPIYRVYHHNDLSFRMLYAFTENFVLPLSHDEVVHGKGSLIGKMPGDEWQKFANLRCLFAYMYGQPGKKLLFMGGEIAQWSEWQHDGGIEWHLMEYERHRGIKKLVGDLNTLYRNEPALHEWDCYHEGFEWVDANDTVQSTVSFLRRGKSVSDEILVVVNFTPVPRYGFRLGAPFGGFWEEILNTDAEVYGGSGHGNMGGVQAEEIETHGRPYSINMTLPPLAAVFLKGRNAENREDG